MGSPSLFPKGKGPYEVKSSSFTGGPYWFPGDHIIFWPFMLSRGSGSLAKLPCGLFVGRNTQVGEVFGKSGNAPHRAIKDISHRARQQPAGVRTHRGGADWVALDPVWLGGPWEGFGDLHSRLVHVTRPPSVPASFYPAIGFLMVSLPNHYLLPLPLTTCLASKSPGERDTQESRSENSNRWKMKPSLKYATKWGCFTNCCPCRAGGQVAQPQVLGHWPGRVTTASQLQWWKAWQEHRGRWSNTRDPGPSPLSGGSFCKRVEGPSHEACLPHALSWVISHRQWTFLGSCTFARLLTELWGWVLLPRTIDLGYGWVWYDLLHSGALLPAPLHLFLHQAVWCGPGTQEMPHVLEFYRWSRCGLNFICLKGDESNGRFKRLPNFPFKPLQTFPAPGSFLVSKTLGSCAQLWRMGRCVVEYKDHGEETLPFQCRLQTNCEPKWTRNLIGFGHWVELDYF